MEQRCNKIVLAYKFMHRIVFEDTNKCHHQRKKAPITSALIGIEAPI